MTDTTATAQGGREDDIKVFCSHDEMVAVERLVPHPRNPNRHPAAQVKTLARVIRGQGWRCPITVSRRSGFVVRGHGRLLAAEQLGVAAVPVDYQDYASEAAEWADLVADNKVAELAHCDEEVLREGLAELRAADFELDLTGMLDSELGRLLGRPAEAPSTQEVEIKPSWQVVCQCANEAEQRSLFERLTAEGIACRLLVL